MLKEFGFLITEAAEAVIVHEALMSYRNRECLMPADHLRAEAADRLLARMDLCIQDLADHRERERNDLRHLDDPFASST